jgi:hypothetical protein
MGRWRALAAPLPWVSVTYLTGLAIFWVVNALGIWVVMQNYALSGFLLPFSYLVIGGWVAWVMEEMPVGRQWAVVALTLAGILLVWGWGYFWMRKLGATWALIFIPMTVAAGLGGAGRGARATLAWAAGFVLALAGLNLYLGDRNQMDRRTLARHLEFDEALYGTVRMIERWDRAGEVWFWDGYDRPKGREHRLLSFFFNWGQSTFGERFPGTVGGIVHAHAPLSTRNNFVIQPGSRVLLFEPTPAEMVSAQAALAERDLKLVKLDQQESLTGGAFEPTLMELWEAVPLENARGVPIEISSAQGGAGVTRDGPAWVYPAGTKEPLWVLALPEAAAPGVVRVRLGANARRLLLTATDAQHRPLAKVRVDPGTATRDVWLTLKPGLPYRFLEVRPNETDTCGSFVVEAAEY